MRRFLLTALMPTLLAACGGETTPPADAADLVLTNARVYTLAWGDPDRDGNPAADAPYVDDRWRPDADAVAIRDGHVLATGRAADIEQLTGPATTVIDLDGATVLPGLVESHGHFNELGEQAERVDLAGVTTMEEMARRVARRADATPTGEWVLGGGWDEGAWADALPTRTLLDEAAPEHPVLLKGRRGFAIVVNGRALALAGVTPDTPTPSGGEIVRDGDGEPTGVFLNRAQALIYDAMPEPTLEQQERRLLYGLLAIASAGYVTGHHAGVYADYMPAYESLAAADRLPIRVEAMIAARPENIDLLNRWIALGPTEDRSAFLQVRGVKAYYDGSLGSRGARLLDDYADQPGHRGVAGEAYGFPEAEVSDAIAAGFQAGLHAIGDAGNRAVLDYYERVLANDPAARGLNHRVEHAQVVHPDDFDRFGALNLVASMQPCHAVEDSPWAEDRLGAERVRGAYAWRSLRRAGADLVFNSDLYGTDYDFFYGLHCAVTRTNRDGEPPGGWYPDEAVTIEEAIRAWTVWPARSSLRGDLTGTLEAGKWADLTVLSIDPFDVAGRDARLLLDGDALMTIVAGEIVHDGR